MVIALVDLMILYKLNIHVPYKVGLYETAKGDDLAIKVMRLDSNYFSDCAAVEIISKTDTSIEGSLLLILKVESIKWSI